PPAFPHVPVSGVGLVSLAILDELRDARETEQANAHHLARQAAELDTQAEDRLADAGAVMVPRRAWWRVPAGPSPPPVEAERLVLRVLALDERLDGLQQMPPPGWRHLAGRVRRRVSERAATKDRVRTAEQLRNTLVLIARTGAEVGAAVPDVQPL